MCYSKFLIVLAFSFQKGFSPAPRRVVHNVPEIVDTGLGIACAKVPIESRKDESVFQHIVQRARSVKHDRFLNESLESIVVWLEIFHCYGFDWSALQQKKSSTIEVLVGRVLDLVERYCKRTGKSWVSWFKLKIATFFSYAAKFSASGAQELPSGWDDPDMGHPGVLLGGMFYRFTQRILVSQKGQSFSLTVLMSKTGMPVPDADMLKQSAEEHIATMTQPKVQGYWTPLEVVPWKEWHEFPLEFDDSPVTEKEVRCELERTAREIFGKTGFSLTNLVKPFIPSASACYGSARANGGTIGFIEDDVRFQGFLGRVEDWFLKEQTLSAQEIKLSSPTSESFSPEGDLEAWLHSDEIRTVIGTVVDADEFQSQFRAFYWKCVSLAMEEEPYVQVVPLAEALKVRCISKGPALTYFVLKPFQKLLWSQLQKFWNFELTGTPITEELMNRRFGRVCPETYRFHSGDYKAATDELHGWVSEHLSKTIFDCLEKESGLKLGAFRVLMQRALTGHKYVNACGDVVPQMRGQLMGSIVSFPFLCLANISLLRMSYESAHGRKCSIRTLPCWVNGDDCLTQYSNWSFPHYWEGIGRVFGFQKSVGKTYDSYRMASINSRFFSLNDQGRWTSIPWCAFRTIHDNSRSSPTEGKGEVQLGNRSYKISLSNASEKVHEMKQNCPTECWDKLYRLFLHRNWEELEKFKGPWFTPKWSGGLGLPTSSSVSYLDKRRVTAAKMLLAAGTQPPRFDRVKDDYGYDLYKQIVRIANPLSTEYFFKKYTGDSGYGDAYVAIWYGLFSTVGFMKNSGSLRPTKVEHKGKKVTKKPEGKQIKSTMATFNRKVDHFLQQHPHVPPCKASDLLAKKLVTVEPVTCLSRL